jgi:hypothetical protein
MALATRVPIVPVRFVGGLPTEPLDDRIEFPVGMGQQDIYFGSPIPPERLEAAPYKARKAMVIEAINALGPDHANETPLDGDPTYAAAVLDHARTHGVSEEHAVLHRVLTGLSDPGEATQRLLAGAIEGDSNKDRWLAELKRRLYGEER